MSGQMQWVALWTLHAYQPSILTEENQAGEPGTGGTALHGPSPICQDLPVPELLGVTQNGKQANSSGPRWPLLTEAWNKPDSCATHIPKSQHQRRAYCASAPCKTRVRVLSECSRLCPGVAYGWRWRESKNSLWSSSEADKCQDSGRTVAAGSDLGLGEAVLPLLSVWLRRPLCHPSRKWPCDTHYM